METDIFDLESAIKVLAGNFPEITGVYLFGSRRFHTGSTRSDIDILLEVEKFIKPALLREFTLKYNSALDLFVMQDGRAISVANESFVEADSNEELIKKLNALLLYRRGEGNSEDLKKLKQIAIDKHTKHKLTVMPNNAGEFYEVKAIQKMFNNAREHGLPAKPYLGASTKEASEYIIEVIKNIFLANRSVTGHGQASQGWTNAIKSEGDFQNLFWITVKPWLPALAREGVAITYDGQEKKPDFQLFNSQLIIEFKHIKNDEDKRTNVKTLEGLKTFYIQHPNVRVFLFVILVEPTVDLDDMKWEADYSYTSQTPSVKTVVIRNLVRNLKKV